MRTKRFTFRIMPIELQALERIAQQEYQGRSQMIRTLIREEAKARGLWPPKPLEPYRGPVPQKPQITEVAK